MPPARFAFLCLFVLLAHSGCTSPWKRRKVHAGDRVFLYVERKDADKQDSSPDYSHPTTVAEEKLTFVLQQLKYEDQPLFGALTLKRLLSAEEIDELAGPLSLALSRSSRDERVRFLVVRSTGKVIPTLKAVSGVAFQKGDTLHLALDTIDESIRVGAGATPEEVRFPYDPEEKTFHHGLVTRLTGTKLHRDPQNGQVHRGWLEIDLAMLEEPPEATKTTAPQVTPTPTEREENLRELSDRLKRLKRLRDDGALTPEEYEKEYERILKDL